MGDTWHELWRVRIETPDDPGPEVGTVAHATISMKEHTTGKTKRFIVQRQDVFDLLVKWRLI